MKAMCLSQPTLLAYDLTSQVNREKWTFLTGILHLGINELVSKPIVLSYSLGNRLGPRHAFAVQLNAGSTIDGQLNSASISLILSSRNDALFVEKISRHCMSGPPAVQYTAAFKAQWQERYKYLRQQRDITIEDIGAHQSILIASVENVLKPRLAVLRSLAAQQADFCLVDHLTAAVTMNNNEFAAAYD